MSLMKVTQCPECESKDIDKTKERHGSHFAQFKCNTCKFEFGEGEYQDIMDSCIHDSFTVWIVETRKQYYERNKYTGKLEEVSSRANESDWSTITCECGDCGKDLDKEEIDRVYEIKDWKPKESVWEIRSDVTRVTDEVHLAFGDSLGEARMNIEKGESHISANYPTDKVKPVFRLNKATFFKSCKKEAVMLSLIKASAKAMTSLQSEP